MKKFLNILILAACILVSMLIQTTVLKAIAIGNISPNLLVILTCIIGLMMGDTYGIGVGFFCGLLCDILFGSLLGFQALIYALIGFLSGKFKNVLNFESLGFILMLTTAGDFVYCFLNYIMQFLLQGKLYFGWFFVHYMIPEILYTLVLSLPAGPLFMLLYERVLKEKKVKAKEVDLV